MTKTDLRFFMNECLDEVKDIDSLITIDDDLTGIYDNSFNCYKSRLLHVDLSDNQVSG